MQSSRVARVRGGAGAAAGLRVLLHAGGDPRERVGRARAGRACTRGRAWPDATRSAPRAARRDACRRCGCAPGGVASRSRTGCWGRRPASSTTSWCGATTAPTPTTSRSSSTTPAQGIEEVVRGADLRRLDAAADLAARALGVPAPAYAHVPLVLGADGRRLAKRHGDVTLREVARRKRFVDGGVAGVAGRHAAEMLDGFDPAAIPREPTIWDSQRDPPYRINPLRSSTPGAELRIR